MTKKHGTALQRAGWDRFERDLNKIEALFKDRSFKGEFRMSTFGDHSGDHEPHEENYCGTEACLGGWLAVVNPRGFASHWHDGTLSVGGGTFSFESNAERTYRMNKGFDALFYDGIGLAGRAALKLKLKHARLLLAYYRNGERDEDWTKFTGFGRTLLGTKRG